MELLTGLYVQTESQFNNRTERRLIILHQEWGRTQNGRWRKAETKANSDNVKVVNRAYFGVEKIHPASLNRCRQIPLKYTTIPVFTKSLFGPGWGMCLIPEQLCMSACVFCLFHRLLLLPSTKITRTNEMIRVTSTNPNPSTVVLVFQVRLLNSFCRGEEWSSWSSH